MFGIPAPAFCVILIVCAFFAVLITNLIMKPIKRRKENRIWNAYKQEQEAFRRTKVLY